MTPKECYQLKYPNLQTPCFKTVGRPCSDETCAVEELEIEKPPASDAIISLDLHLTCRFSYLASDPQEFIDLKLQKI